MNIDSLEYLNLLQLTKTLSKPSIQCYRIEEKKAIYYELYVSSRGVRINFAIDNYYPSEYIKIVDNIINEEKFNSVNCIALVHIKTDNVLFEILNYFKYLINLRNKPAKKSFKNKLFEIFKKNKN